MNISVCTNFAFLCNQPVCAALIGLWLTIVDGGNPTFAQVPNDHVEGRIALAVNALPYQSNTSSCTVDWGCVQESLTGKCIEYHNDQWFEFTTRQPGRYCINVSRQACRDIRGIQLVVIDGQPCQPATYRVLSCTSLATQDDIYVSLGHLPAKHTYMLNVDGYLNDFCRFSIQVSTRPKGFPARSVGLREPAHLQTDEKTVLLDWTVSDSLAASLNRYHVYRRFEKEKKSGWIRFVRHEKNTRGASTLRYSMVDTLLEKGTYTYQVMGFNADSAEVWIEEKIVDYNPDVYRPEDYINLRLQYAFHTPLTILIFDATTDRLLRRTSFVFQRKARPWQYDVGDWRRQGIYRFKVKITDDLRKTSREYTFDTRKPSPVPP